MEKLNLELRSVSFNEKLSEETYNFSAKLFLDGKHIANVSNHGTGGPTSINPVKGYTYAQIKALEKQIEETYPKLTYKSGDETHSMDNDIEVVINKLVTYWIRLRTLKRFMRTHVAFVKPGEEHRGSYSYIKLQKTHPISAHVEHIQKKYPGAKVLNTMIDIEALALTALPNEEDM